jgi:hypothetical protein
MAKTTSSRTPESTAAHNIRKNSDDRRNGQSRVARSTTGTSAPGVSPFDDPKLYVNRWLWSGCGKLRRLIVLN